MGSTLKKMIKGGAQSAYYTFGGGTKTEKARFNKAHNNPRSKARQGLYDETIADKNIYPNPTKPKKKTKVGKVVKSKVKPKTKTRAKTKTKAKKKK